MKKGFTLFELLAVLTILGLVLAITIPSIGDIISRNREKLYIETENRILDAAKSYTLENPIELPSIVGNSVKIDISTLIENKHLQQVKDLKDKDEICTGYVLITKVEDNYEMIPYINCPNYISKNVVDEGLILDMPLGDYISGSNFIDKKENYVGTNVNGVSATNRFGESGEATYFNGTNAYVNIVNDSQLTPKSITLSSWINMDITASTARHIFFTNWGGYSVEIEATTRRPYFRLQGVADVYSSENLVLGNWYNVVCTFEEGKSLKIYLNGQLKGTVITANPIVYSNNTVLNIGRYAGGVYFKGIIDDARIYNRALNSDEVLHNYIVESQVNVD